MQTCDLQWLAGIIDSEGCFGIRLNKSKRSKSGIRCCSLVIATTDSVIVPKVCDILGAHYTLKNPSGAAKSRSKSIKIVGSQLRLILPQIISFLYTKQPHAKLVLEALNIKNGTNTPYTDDEAARWEDLRQKISILNGRGIDTIADNSIREHIFSWPWVAGLIDGDGSIHIETLKKNNSTYYRPALSINMAHNNTISYLSIKLQLSQINSNRPHGNKRKTTRVRALYNNLSRILPDIIPYLILKKRKAEVALEICKLRESLLSGEHSGPKINTIKLLLESFNM